MGYEKDNTMDLTDHVSQDKNFKGSLVSSDTVRALVAGDHAAFEDIFVKYLGKVKHFIYLLIRSFDTAEELSQEIFVKLWQNREQLDPNKNFNAYIYTIARNTVFNYIKSKNVRDRYAKSVWEIEYSPDAEELLAAEELELIISIAVGRMPKQRRKIFEMSRNKGMGKDEIAQELDITINAVEKQLRYALDTLRDIIA